MDIADFNRRWLQQWSDTSVEGVLGFYHPEVTYFDENVPNGLVGTMALRNYLPVVFAQVPEWDYQPDDVWEIAGGFCGRWYMDLGTGADKVRLRGFDQCLMTDGLISHNEVYTRRLSA